VQFDELLRKLAGRHQSLDPPRVPVLIVLDARKQIGLAENADQLAVGIDAFRQVTAAIAGGCVICAGLREEGLLVGFFPAPIAESKKTSAGHQHLNIPPCRPAHHPERAVVGLDPHATVGPGVIPERGVIVKPRKCERRLQCLLVRAGKRRPIQNHKT
jgi:hypothetical protein